MQDNIAAAEDSGYHILTIVSWNVEILKGSSTKFTHKGHFIRHKVVLALLEYLYNVFCAAEFKAENKI